MNRPIDKLEAEALELSSSERARLASLLLASLEQEPEAQLGEIERAWSEEIQKRITEIRAGHAKLVPAEDVVAALKNRSA